MRTIFSLLSFLAFICIVILGGLFNTTKSQIGTTVISQKFDKAIGGTNSAILVPSNLSEEQLRNLNLAYTISVADGSKNPEILQGILMQETKAGGLKSYKVAGQEFGLKSNERYYGITQIKLSAAKDVLSAYPSLKTKHDFQTNTDEEIIAHLIMSNEFNLEVASKYLKILSSVYKLNVIESIAAYNQGPSGQRLGKGREYVESVMKHLQSLKNKSE